MTEYEKGVKDAISEFNKILDKHIEICKENKHPLFARASSFAAIKLELIRGTAYINVEVSLTKKQNIINKL
jgi:hypothetical protein